ELDQDMANETRAETFIRRQCVTASNGQLPLQFAERVVPVKPAIVFVMLDNPAGDTRANRILIVNKLRRMALPHARLPIADAKQVRHGGAGQKIRIVDESKAMRKIIHAAELYTAGRERDDATFCR